MVVAEVPNLEKLARRSIVFFSSNLSFSVSLVSLVDDVRFSRSYKMLGNGGSFTRDLQWQRWLKSYATPAIIGGITMTDQASGFKRGFDVYDDQFL